ncbi:MAG TPA: Os1348 family NHLP clan protein [Bryobacteraceae bacterium]|nr:Os1348 family NHLP clan protein [Bryobacteraceae bacterium]
MSDLHKVLTKALNDPKFAASLKSNPAEALRHVGVEATPAKLAALKDSVDSLGKAQHVFGGPEPY